jgi:hypothetical protein
LFALQAVIKEGNNTNTEQKKTNTFFGKLNVADGAQAGQL